MNFIAYNATNYKQIEYIKKLPPEVREEIDVVSRVLPFKTNNYVVDYLIDWDNYERDPVYILTFPNRHMLPEEDYYRVRKAMRDGMPEQQLTELINSIRLQLNPHPANQQSNVPSLDGAPLPGVQHKYEDIVLFFPSQGQTCHANCTFCFRWPQFVKDLDLQFAMKEIDDLVEYIRRDERIHEILFTGGDPMIMSPDTLNRYIEKIIDAKIPHLDTIRFGSKSLTYWPFTFLPEFNEEAPKMLDLFKKIVDNGYHLSFMAHFNHWQEMNNGVVKQAVENIRNTGANIRTQAPILNNINNDSEVWAKMWRMQVGMGLVPYYMFVERETGPYDYFGLPLARVYRLYADAIRTSSSFAKTVTGPTMSASPGKVQILGIVESVETGSKYFKLQFVRHRDRNRTFKPFLAEYDDKATWFDQLNLVEEQVPVYQ
jgi:L-lysine 2,3-aminomutase